MDVGNSVGPDVGSTLVGDKVISKVGTGVSFGARVEEDGDRVEEDGDGVGTPVVGGAVGIVVGDEDGTPVVRSKVGLVVGDEVGTPIVGGTVVGDGVGTPVVGGVDGIVVGDEVGTPVVGGVDGIVVGDEVGAPVVGGTVVGDGVGTPVAGGAVGIVVGDEVGTPVVGGAAGLVVGNGVGAPVVGGIDGLITGDGLLFTSAIMFLTRVISSGCKVSGQNNRFTFQVQAPCATRVRDIQSMAFGILSPFHTRLPLFQLSFVIWKTCPSE